MKRTDIKIAVHELLEKEYPEIKIYGKEIKEGYKPPCFFVEILDKGQQTDSKSYARGGFTVFISYFQTQTYELDQLQKIDEIKLLFGMVLKVGNRILTVGEYTYDYTGEYDEILQISIDFDYKENIMQPETEETAAEVNVKLVKG